MSALPFPWLPSSHPPACDPDAPLGISIECVGVVNGVLAPIYAEGNLPDKDIDKCRFASPNDWFELRKQALAKRIQPPAWSADPMLAWIPARSADYREAA